MERKHSLRASFIPRFVPNRLVLFGYRMLKLFTHKNKMASESRFENNLTAIREMFADAPIPFIENEAELSRISFGQGIGHGDTNVDFSYSGCQVISVINALKCLGKDLTPADMASIIGYFDAIGTVNGGKLGVLPQSVKSFMKKRGYSVKAISSTDAERLDQLGREYDTFIATAFNDKYNIFRMVHAVCIEKRHIECSQTNATYADQEAKSHQGDISFVIHNGYRYNPAKGYVESKGYGTLSEALSYVCGEGNSKPIFVIGILNK